MKIKEIVMITVIAASQAACAPKLPDTPKCDVKDTYFGVEVADPYRWLEDDNSEQTAAWVEAQNKYTNHYLRGIPYRNALLKRLQDLTNFERIGAPSRHRNGKWYFYRNDGLQNQSVLYEQDSPGAEARVLLDPNSLSDDGTVALKGVYFSRDSRYLAYSISRSGSDWQEFYVMNVQDGTLLEDHIEWAKFSGAAWHGDGFYYSAYDAPSGDGAGAYSAKNEGHKIYYHKLGTPQSEDKLFYNNPDCPLRFYTLSTNEEETMAFLTESGADNGNNLYVKDLRKDSGFVPMTSDMKNECYAIETEGNLIYIFTNKDAPKYRLVVANLSNPGSGNWKTVIPESENVLAGVDFISDKLLLTYSKDAATDACRCTKDGKLLRKVEFPGVGTAGFSCRKGEDWCYYAYTSFTTPGTIYSYDINSGESEVYTKPAIGFDTSLFESRQLFFASKDGTRIPMSITYRKGMQPDGTNPVLLYGYGGFNISLPPSFSSSRIPFIENGGIYAQVNLRGGGEYGEEWHMAGTRMNKQNVFDDFIAAARYLIAEGYTCPEKLAIMGGSNGGLLVGACMTQEPELFAVAIPEVGVMDMLRYHKFTIGWNWAPDYGTSEESEEMFRYLYSYSPLHNIREGVAYPATLITTADHDDRVVPAHSFKFAATLQACNAGNKPALIRIDTKAGHGGGKPLSKVLEETADIYAFIFKNLGMEFKRSGE